MILPSIYCKAVDKYCSIIGDILSSMMNWSIEQDGCAPIQQHIRAILTNHLLSASTYPRYVSYYFDVMSNWSATHNDTKMIINRDLTIADYKYGGLGVRGKGDSSFLGSVDSK